MGPEKLRLLRAYARTAADELRGMGLEPGAALRLLGRRYAYGEVAWWQVIELIEVLAVKHGWNVDAEPD